MFYVVAYYEIILDQGALPWMCLFFFIDGITDSYCEKGFSSDGHVWKRINS